MIEERYKLKKDETAASYKFRICHLGLSEGKTWQQIADIINEGLDESHSESTYRKQYHIMKNAYQKSVEETKSEARPKKVKAKLVDQVDMEVVKAIELKREIQKERAKLSDERIQNNAYIRQIAREETLKEIAEDIVSKMNVKRFLTSYKPYRISNTALLNDEYNEGILELSDWHYGAYVDNAWNVYSPEICAECISTLRDKVIERCELNNVKVLHVLDLGDLINGIIHLPLRLESRRDVITQVIESTEILSELLNDLSAKYEVHFYWCTDNHSRIDPNKKDAIDLESMARLTPWYLKSRLGDRIIFHDNEYGDDIITLKSKGYDILGCHGDKDKISRAVDSLTCMTQHHWDMVCTAHLHHFSADEQRETVVVSNGAVLGTDTYAKNLRLCSKPSQNLIIVSDDSVCEAIYRIILR